ncbi:hypothetical protein OW666_07380 [Acinetobacter baumannii]|uniref:hypothetical protein n=1 Tax=Acinetobacter baumannii TaxID=470 RepID=UPI0024DE9194|nr:hypothetical protein [Acinetobacter baumannii]MDK2128726.1 hypothetical protein [Acinetobacter baumannii]MDK2159336.1 hypothetical protein [Acinetobacter baumannii]MDK2166880.1 hypothetical protein [Acinetobacter baumannii]MDK2250372.1 hypothetical protein [Acinetobacter baumannii]MDK2261577.1 hypothetical protein [Acinetobacter baumannii]
MTDLNKEGKVNLSFEQDNGAVWVFAGDSQFGTEISHLMMMHADEYSEDELRVICHHAACEIDRLRAELEKAKAQAVPENTEDWYLDEDEGLWLDHDGIDGTLCELGIGEVKPVKHKEYLITQSNTLYAARVWDSDDDHIAWKLFESEESALEAATYCKQMYEASESGAEG